MFAVFKRDFLSYFRTPIGYAYMAIYLAANGGVFSIMTLQQKSGAIANYMTTMIFVTALLIPFLTMKLFSEEKKTRTEQLLLTSPASLGGIVLGKFLAAFAVYLGTFIIGCINYLTLFKFAAEEEPNTATIFGSSVAIVLIASVYIAVGLFVSALTENQLIAAFGSIGITAIFLIIGMLNKYIPYTWLKTALSWLSIYTRFGNFTNGYFDYAGLLYYISITFVFLFVTIRVYERRRWA